MTRVCQGDVVRLHYTGKLTDGSVFDSTRESQPLQLKIGDGSALQSFEAAIEDMQPGETKTITIPTSQAYGRRLRNMERVLRPELVPTGVDLRVGQYLRIQPDNQPPAVVKILHVGKSHVVVDMNHPLAGEDLVFEIELLEIM